MESGYLRTLDPEGIAYLMIHLMELLIERELASWSDHPYHDMMDLAGLVFERSMRKPSEGDAQG